ncbi:hypothetical protein AgCh_020206 [Apium graveolens]
MIKLCLEQINNQHEKAFAYQHEEGSEADQFTSHLDTLHLDLSSPDDPPGLKLPTDYTLVWSTESYNVTQDNIGYIWLPVAPDGYTALGHVVTTSPQKPPLDKVRVVRTDLTESVETDTWIWGGAYGFHFYSSRPVERGTEALDQVKALIQTYAPVVYFHPDELFFPSSVNWFFQNGALLFTKGKESDAVSIAQDGSNLHFKGSSTLSMHDKGNWASAPDLEFEKNNKPIMYASKYGHASYTKAGMNIHSAPVQQEKALVGAQNDTSKSDVKLDTGKQFWLLSADYSGGLGIIQKPWLNYAREWGPKRALDFGRWLNNVEKLIPGEEGSTGPKWKDNWSGDERV